MFVWCGDFDCYRIICIMECEYGQKHHETRQKERECGGG